MSPSVGQRVVSHGEPYVVTEVGADHRVVLKCLKNAEEYTLDLHDEAARNLILGPDDTDGDPNETTSSLQGLEGKRLEAFKRRLEAIMPLANLPHRSSADVEDRAKEVGMSSRTLFRLLARHKSFGPEGLMIPESFGGKGRPRVDRVTEGIIKTILENYYLSKQRPKPTVAYRLIEAECAKQRAPPPCLNTLYDRINHLDLGLRTKARLGTKAFGEAFELRGGVFREQQFPLQTVEIDHTKIDLLVRDEATQEVVSRVWLTTALDVYSRCVWGYYLGFEEPSANTVGLVMAMGTMQKDDLVTKFGLTDWPVYGIPYQIHTDNGKDLVSWSVEAGCIANTIQIARRPVHVPRYGGHVERIVRTFNDQFIHTLPGTTFSNPRERGEYDFEKEAALTMKDLEKLLLMFIVNEYHNTIHRTLGMTPLNKWKRGVEEPYWQPQLPVDPEKYRRDFLPIVEPDGLRHVEKDGVHYRNQVYYSPELSSIQHRGVGSASANQHRVRYDPFDMRHLYLYDEVTKRQIQLTQKDPPDEPYTLRELIAEQAQRRADGFDRTSESVRLLSIIQRREALDSLAADNKKARKEMARTRRQLEMHQRSKKEASPEPIQPDSDIEFEPTIDPQGIRLMYGEYDGGV